jgi:hypothetical protein
MAITSADRATLSAQLGELSEEELQALLSSYHQAITIVSTPPDTTHTSASAHAHAHHQPLPNLHAGSSLLTMTSSRCRQSSIHEHFRRGAHHLISTTPWATSRRAATTPGIFPVVRSQSPPPATMHTSHHGGGNVEGSHRVDQSYHDGLRADRSPHGGFHSSHVGVHTPTASIPFDRHHHGSTAYHGGPMATSISFDQFPHGRLHHGHQHHGGPSSAHSEVDHHGGFGLPGRSVGHHHGGATSYHIEVDHHGGFGLPDSSPNGGPQVSPGSQSLGRHHPSGTSHSTPVMKNSRYQSPPPVNSGIA